MQGCGDNHKPLEPHSDVNNERKEKHERNAGAQFLEPEALRRNHVTRKHRPVRPGIRPERAVVEGELLVHIAAVPRHKKFHRVGVADNAARDEHNFVHHFQVIHRNEVL